MPPPKQRSQTVCLLCSPGFTAVESQRKKRASVMRSEGILVRQKFVSALSAGERGARAVSLLLRGEPGFNGTTLPLHLPARISQATAACMWARDCHSAYLSAACELHTPSNSWQKLFVFRHTLEADCRHNACGGDMLNPVNKTAEVTSFLIYRPKKLSQQLLVLPWSQSLWLRQTLL